MAGAEDVAGWLVEIGKSVPPFLFASLAITASFLVYFYKPYWDVRKVPGPPTTPLLGHLPLLAKHGPDVLITLAKRYGSIFRFHLGRQPLVIIADPELCREVGIKKFKHFTNRSPISPFSTPIRSKVLFTSRDKRWSVMRNTMTALYQPTYVSMQLPIMKSVVDSLISNLSNSKGDEVIFSNLSILMSTDVIGHSAFGLDFGLSSQCSLNGIVDPTIVEVEELATNYVISVTNFKMDLTGTFSIILGLLFPLLQNPLSQILKRIPWTMDWKVHKSDQNLKHRLDEIVMNRSNEREQGDHVQSKDFLTLILNARESQKATKDLFTPDYISSLAYEHLLAGSATTAFTLSSILYLVAGHPDVERKLIKEVDDFGSHNMPTADDLLQKFPYLNQVIKEAMRFYTASPLVARETSSEVEIGGYVLPKGTWVWLALGVMGKDPKQFPEPDKFKPERFDANCDEEKRRHPYATIPFGIGPRICIGHKLALQEIRVAMFYLYQRFVFRHSPSMEKPLALEYGIVLNFKHGVKLRVINRT